MLDVQAKSDKPQRTQRNTEFRKSHLNLPLCNSVSSVAYQLWLGLVSKRVGVRYRPCMPLFTRHADGSFRADTSRVVGDVTVGADASFWFGAVVRGDVAQVRIGSKVNVQDNAVVHCDSGVPNVIEDDVVIGHGAVVHGMFVGEGSLIGMSATVLGKSKIGRECLIAAGAVVPPGLDVPDRMVVMGVPGKIVRPVKPEELQYMRWLRDHYVELAKKYVGGAFDK